MSPLDNDSLIEKFLAGELSEQETRRLLEMMESDDLLAERLVDASQTDFLLRSLPFYHHLVAQATGYQKTEVHGRVKAPIISRFRWQDLRKNFFPGFFSSLSACVVLWLLFIASLLYLGYSDVLTVQNSDKRSRPRNLPALQECQLVFMQEGKPLANAVISLRSTVPAQQHWAIGGFTDGHGRVTLLTHTFFEGVPRGEYRVLVSKYDIVVPQVQNFPTNIEEQVEINNHIEQLTRVFSLVEHKFSQKETTPLSLQITSGSNHAVFDVGEKVHLLQNNSDLGEYADMVPPNMLSWNQRKQK